MLCVRSSSHYSLSHRDLRDLTAQAGLALSDTPVRRWVQRYAPILSRRIRRELRRPNRSWSVDETRVGLAGDWV